MAEQSLDILIKLAVQGDAEAKKKLAEVIKSGTAEQKQQVEVAKAVVAGMEKEIAATKEVLGETDKGTEAKKKYKEAVKGLALEFPLLARVMGLLSNPIGGTIAVLGTLIAVLKNYCDSVREAGIASQALERASVSANILAAAHRDVAAATAEFHREFEKIGNDTKTAGEKLTEYNRQLLLKQQLEQALDDAQLGAEIQGIEGNADLSPTEKIQKIAAAQSAARGRKVAREETTLQAQASADALTAYVEGERARKLAGEANAAGPAVADAAARATAAEQESAGFPEATKKRREELAGMLETARTLMGAGPMGVKNFQLLNPGASSQLNDNFPGAFTGDISFAEVERRVLAEQKGMGEQGLGAERRAATLRAEADRLAKEKSDKEAEATKAEATRREKSASSEAKYDELNTRRAYRGVTEPIIRQTETEKANAAARAARDREEAEQEAAAEYLRRINRPGAPSSNTSASVIGPESTSTLLGALGSQAEFNGTALQQFGDIARTLADHDQRIKDLRLS